MHHFLYFSFSLNNNTFQKLKTIFDSFYELKIAAFFWHKEITSKKIKKTLKKVLLQDILRFSTTVTPQNLLTHLLSYSKNDSRQKNIFSHFVIFSH